MDKQELIKRIDAFLETYAKISPNWDGDDIDEKWTSPDAYQLYMAARLLEMDRVPQRCWSDYDASGGYRTTPEGRIEHDIILKAIASCK
jgi:hypothetical protein